MKPVESFSKMTVEVDAYLSKWLVQEPQAMSDAVKHSSESELPPIQVAPTQGKLLTIFAKLVQAKQILEIGTLGGYSGLWLAEALPEDGKLLTLEFAQKHANVALENFKRANQAHKVEIRVGAALDLLPAVENEFGRTFDLVFIDADKQSMPEYFEWALKLTRSGGLIISDNVVREGKILDKENTDPQLEGVRQFLQSAGKKQSTISTAIQTIGSKGHDGFAVTYVQ